MGIPWTMPGATDNTIAATAPRGYGRARPARAAAGVRVAVAFALAIMGGCFQPDAIRPEQLDRGYVLMLPGVECYASHHEGIYRGLRDAGESRAIEINEWGYRPFGTFPNLMSYELNRERARRLAEKLTAYSRDHPGAPITVIGYSGGGAMALFTAEALPEGVLLDRIVLLGAAISPGYDVGPALARCRRGVANFYSERDRFMGGWATETFGTMDRRKTRTAGHVGFRDAAGGLLVSQGLVQNPWRPEWQRFGNGGGHGGWRARAWAREVLAPCVRAAADAQP